MTGAIVSLKVKGQQDAMLTSAPARNFLVKTYDQYMDTATEHTKLYFYENVDFGRRISIQVPKKGDFLSRMYLCFTLPALTPTNGTYAAWTNSIGHAIVDYIDLEIGNKVIDKHYGLFLEVWEELTGKDPYENVMIGKTSTTHALHSNASVSSSYQVPLRFFFCNHLWSALPLLCMQYHNVKITIKLREFSQCVIHDGSLQPASVSILDAYVLTEYIYINDTDRIKYKSMSHELLITQCQYTDNTADETNSSGSSFRVDIPFNHPVKELLWVFIETESINNNDWFNFSKRNNVPFTKVYSLMKNCKLLIEGKEVSEQLDEAVYGLVNTNKYHTNRSDRYVYCYSFCPYPENWEPSGTINFSKLDNATLTGDIRTPVSPSRVYVFGLNYNWMVIENGLTALRYIA